jgi:hypothetical protein
MNHLEGRRCVRGEVQERLGPLAAVTVKVDFLTEPRI